jgi:hypothetical protein
MAEGARAPDRGRLRCSRDFQPRAGPGLRSAPLRFLKPARGFPWFAAARRALASRALLAHVSAWFRCLHVLTPLLRCLRRTPGADVDKRWRARYLIPPTFVNPEPSVVREVALLCGKRRCPKGDRVSPDPRREPAAGAPWVSFPTMQASEKNGRRWFPRPVSGRRVASAREVPAVVWRRSAAHRGAGRRGSGSERPSFGRRTSAREPKGAEGRC